MTKRLAFAPQRLLRRLEKPDPDFVRPEERPNFQNDAKRKGMRNEKIHLGLSELILRSPAYPKIGNRVIQKLKKALDLVECAPRRELTLKQFGQLIGAPKSTIHDWYYGDLVAAIEHFVCALERLSEVQRQEFIGQFCRECPRLQHPRLIHDRIAINSLGALLKLQSGLTFIIGSTDEVRTFVMTALGNSAMQLLDGKFACGIDVHKPDLFIPAPGVLYFENPKDPTMLRKLIRHLWNEVENCPAKTVLINGVWNGAPEMRDKITACSKNRHVIVVDQFDAGVPRRSNGRPMVCNIIAVSSDANQRIHLLIQTSGSRR
jgi:hypothetical protein